jgi:hypothetical protein
MANTVIQLRHSTLTGNVPSTLANGEISINNRDGKFFYSTPAGAIITHYPYTGPAGLNQEVQFNDSGVLGSDSGLTYNKTTDVLTVVGGAIVGGINVAPQIQFAYNHANAAYATANTKDFTFYQDTAPSTANSRDAWIDTDTGVLYKNFGNVTNPVWVETGPTGFSNVSGALAGDLVVSGNITPLTDNVYSLGSASYRFKDVFVGPGSVNIDGLVLSNVNGKLIINGASDLVLPGTEVPTSLSISNHANSAFVSANGTAIAANTPSHVANSASSYANSSFNAANTADTKAISAGSYANSAFAVANAATATDVTQNNSITAAFITANTPSHVANSAAIYANGAFTKANNALANTSGTLDGNLNITGNVGIGIVSPGSRLDVKGTLRLSGATSGYVGLAPAAAAGSTTYTLPTADGTTGQVLSTNGSGTLSWATAGGGGFPTGTLMLFQQTAAPTGWTKQTTHDNKALRVVSGTASTGGSVAFTTAFASQAVSGTVGSTTLSTSQIPSHSHSISAITGTDGGGGDSGVAGYNGVAATQTTNFNTGSAGSGGSHNHSFTGTAINLAVSYVDLIIASKD